MQSLLPVTLDGDTPEHKRQQILEYFQNSYALFESLFELFKDDSVFYRQSEPTRHPMIFYFGHTAAFYINKLILGQVITERINPDFESLFAIGVDEMNWDDLDENHYEWPDVSAVRQYRLQVKMQVEALIQSLPLTLPIAQDDPFWIILMGIEHERIHIETSSVLHRQMPLEYIKRHTRFDICSDSGVAPENAMVHVKGADVVLGKAHDHHLYGWDNEYGSLTCKVKDFEVSKYLVSNGEFLPFVRDGGYEDERFWDQEGRKFLLTRKVNHPAFWVYADKSYKLRTLDREIDLPLDWPVEVNYLEAMAFCRYKSEQDGYDYRLCSEAEWMRLHELSGLSEIPDPQHANINLEHYASPCPVNRFKQGEFYDVTGNVWQWTQSPIDGFEGFEPHPVYDDFSTPTFDGKHNLIKGGSFISTGNELTAHSRYAFRRHFYQHAGFRYVKGTAASFDENIYESDALVSQYCEFQYGDEYFNVENFAKKCARLAISYAQEGRGERALDLGCATGRASFELARHFDEVTGIDFSARFIQVGVELQERGVIHYERAEEGELTSRQTQSLKECDLLHVKDKVTFWQGDACNLKTHFSGYDLVMATNLIDRLYEPHLFLERVHERINDKGLLILTSPYTWLEAYTQKQFWLGGYTDEEGNEISTFETIKAILGTHFELIDTHDIEFVIRETPRKFQHSVAQMSVWKKH